MTLQPGNVIKFLSYGLPVVGTVISVNKHPGRGKPRPDTYTVYCDDLERRIEIPSTCNVEVIEPLPLPIPTVVRADRQWREAQRQAESANVRYLSAR